jgi:hypothetical protein
MYRSSSSRSCGVTPRDRLQSDRSAGSRSRRVPLARRSVLFTEATVVVSTSAVAPADQASTSRRISTARWCGVRCWIAARKASSTVSRATAAVCGSVSAEATRSSSTSGQGCSQDTSSSGCPDAGSGGRLRCLSRSRHAFVAMPYSHARTLARPA